MTTGYPDFQAYPTWITPDLAPANPVTLPAGPTTLFSGAASNFASLRVAVTPLSGFGKVSVNWWNDAGFTMGAGVQTIRCTATTAVSVILPVQAQYVTVTFNNTSGGSMTANVQVAGTNIQTASAVYPILSSIQSPVGISVAGSGSNTRYLPLICAGLAFVSVTPPDAAGKLHYQLLTVDETGTQLGILADLGNPVAPVSQLFMAPDEIIAMLVTNSDTIAHLATYYIAIPGKA